MDTPKSSAPRAPEDPKIMLATLEERYRHELLDEAARCEVRERIVRLRRKLSAR